jgi:predicted chitinase
MADNTTTQENKYYIPNFAYPFKKIKDEKTCFEMLKDKAEGNYLFSEQGLWHGGMHFDSFFDKEIKCIADGEIVAYRINDKYLDDKTEEKEIYSNGFFLVKHYFEYPKENKLTFFSLYMHTAKKEEYDFSTHKAVGTNRFLRKGISYKEEDKLEELDVNTKITIGNSLDKNRYEVLYVEDIKREDNATIHKSNIEKLDNSSSKVITKDSIPNNINILSTPIKIKAGETIGLKGIYGKIDKKGDEVAHIEVFTKDDVQTFAQKAKEHYENKNIKEEDKPKAIQIKIPKDIEIYEIIEQKIVKTKDANDTATLKDDCNTQNEIEPLNNDVEIDVKEDSLVCNNRYEIESINGEDVSDQNLSIYKGSVETIKKVIKTNNKQREEIIVNLNKIKTIEYENKKYVYLEDKAKVYLYEECKEIHPITLEWAKIIDMKSNDKVSMFENIEDLIITDVSNEVKLNSSYNELFKLIDKDNNNMLDFQELKEAVKNKDIKEIISKYIVKHSSEWDNEINLAQVIIDRVGNNKNKIDNIEEFDLYYEKVEERIKNLSFFAECKTILNFAQSDEVYHFNPIGLVGVFGITKKGCLTIDKFTQIFPNAPEEKRKEVLEVFNKYCQIFEINTPLRVAHFFAQIKEEVGNELVGKIEDLTYSVEALKSLFSRYFKNFPEDADLYGYKGQITSSRYNSLSEIEKQKYKKYGNKYYTQIPNEDEIAKRVYCCNGEAISFTNCTQKGGCEEGITYKGKGFMQLTWKNNYKAVNNILQIKTPDENIDIVTNPDSVLETKIGMLSAMGFWEWQKLNDKADNGATDSVVDSITAIVNLRTRSYSERRTHFNSIYNILQ